MIEQVILAIRPLDQVAIDNCQLRLDNLTKPLDSLHSFEHLARKMAGITRTSRPRLLPSGIVIMNGSLRTPGLCDIFAANVSARVISFDVQGEEPWTREQMAEFVKKGIQIAGAATAAGMRVIGTGMVGAISPVVTSALQAWHAAGGEDPVAALAATGCPEIAGLTGVMLGAAAGGAAVVLDGVETCLAALVAVNMSPQVREYLVGSHFGRESSHAELLQLLEVPAYLSLDMNLGEGVGAALGISLIQAALHVLNDMKTFGEAEVHVAEDGPGALVQNAKVRD